MDKAAPVSTIVESCARYFRGERERQRLWRLLADLHTGVLAPGPRVGN